MSASPTQLPNCARSDPPPIRDPLLWAIVSLSGAVKLWLAFTLDSTPPILDEQDYLNIAQGIATQARYVGAFRPPLYPAYMAMMIALGWGTLGIRIGQVLMSILSTVLAYRIARRMWGRRAAIIAAGTLALDPVLIMFSHRLWSETLYIVLLLAALDILSAPPAIRKRWPWLAAGLLFGLAGLTRPAILTFVPLLLPWAILQAKRPASPSPPVDQPPETAIGGITVIGGGLRFALLLIACAAAIVPWTIRNARAYNALVIVDTNGPFNFLVGTQPDAAFVDKDNFWSRRFGLVEGQPYQRVAKRDAAAAQRLAVQQAWENIKHAPGLFVRKCLWEARRLWTLDSFLLRHLRNGWYARAAAPWFIAAATLLAAGFFVMLVLAGFTGLATEPPSPLRGLTLLLIIHAVFLFGLTYSLSRYCLPLHAVLAIPAAGLLADFRRRLTGLRAAGFRSRRNLILTAVLLIVAWQWVSDMPLIADMINNAGAGYLFRME